MSDRYEQWPPIEGNNIEIFGGIFTVAILFAIVVFIIHALFF